MTDSKFRKDKDRIAITLEAKKRIIDLMENGFELPETGIYDEPVRYFKANLKWTPIIFGWLTWLEDVAGWRDAEGEDYRGITEILTFEEGIDNPMATKDDIRDGMYEALNRLALQIATGQYANVNLSTDADGTVTQPPAGGDAGLPEDDPDTEWSEAKAAKYGGAVAVGRAINDYIARIDTLYGTDATADTPLAQAQFTITMLYEVDVALSDNALDAYYTYRAVPNSQLGTLGTSTFYNHLYCNGYSFESIVEWILDGLSITFAKEQQYIKLIEALGDTFYSEAFAAGVAVPSLEYIAAPCEPVATETLTLDMSTAEFPQKTTNAVHKAGHRLLFEISGTFVDSDVPDVVNDFFYYSEITSGIKTYVPTYYIISGAGGISEPSQALVPYQADHSYSITIDVPTTGGGGTILVGRDNNPFTLPNVSGILTIKITDLGQYS